MAQGTIKTMTPNSFKDLSCQDELNKWFQENNVAMDKELRMRVGLIESCGDYTSGNGKHRIGKGQHAVFFNTDLPDGIKTGNCGDKEVDKVSFDFNSFGANTFWAFNVELIGAFTPEYNLNL